VPLIVVHGHYEVVSAAHGLQKYGVWRDRSAAPNPRIARRFHRRERSPLLQGRNEPIESVQRKLHPTYRTPVFGLVAQGVWTSVLCISGTYSELLNYVIFATIIFYFLTTFSLFRLRRVRPDLPRPVRAFGYPVLPALYMAANAFLLVVLLADPQQRKFSALGLLIVALGVPVYLVWRRNRVA